jgi:activator of HSP90 ATPase
VSPVSSGSCLQFVRYSLQDVPKDEAEKVKEGWRTNYMRRINSVFGYGADFGSF